MISLGICSDDTLTFDSHINDICLKASRQISALQRLTGLLDYPSRRAVYNSFISSHFNYCPLVCFFTNRACIVKMQKIQERALRFVLKDSVSDYKFFCQKAVSIHLEYRLWKIWPLKLIRFWIIWARVIYHHFSRNQMFLISWDIIIN